MFRVEPFYLLSYEVREPRNYMAVLRAIGQGNHTLEMITLAAGFQTKQHASTYLSRLQDLYLIFRQTPATIREEGRTTQDATTCTIPTCASTSASLPPTSACWSKG